MIHLTDAALVRVRHFAAKDGADGILISVKKSGCSGYGYDIQLAKDIDAEQMERFAYGNVAVYVSKDDLPMLNGLTLDVKKQGLNETFSFDNPQAEATCGCGTSFSLSQ